MRRTAPLALAGCLLLTACGVQSTLAEDDQQFCADQEDELGFAREAVAEIIDGDRHWSSETDGWAMNDVAITPASRFLTAHRPQDDALSNLIDRTDKALFEVTLDLDMEDDAFENDAESSREAAAALEDLQEFCDDNA